MALALLSRARSKPQSSMKPISKKKSGGVKRAADGWSGFAKPVFQPQTAAHPTGPWLPLSSVRGGILQRKCACGGATGMSGDCEECSKKRLGLQTKLTINEPGDVYEQEADQIADQVMATSANPAVSAAPPRIQRFSGQSNGQMDAAPASVDQVLASPGRPLEPALRRDMEQRFSHDFSTVRVHTGAAAERSARDVDAHAYTVGHDIVFGAGRFAPGTHEGRRLVAHELTHVVQQSGSDATRLDQSDENRGLSLIPTIPTHPKLQRQPEGFDTCRPSKDLAPREWLRCVHTGRIQPGNEYPLRFTFTGVVATRDEFVKWVAREGITEEVAIARVMHSHEFAGTDKAREEAKAQLITAIPREKLSACIRPVQIADDNGKKPTVLPSFAAATTIWGKCCLDLSVNAAKIVSKTAFKTLDHEEGARATAEEASLIKAAGGAGGCISVFVAETFQQGGMISKDISGGAATFGTPFGPAVVVVEGVDPTIVAHELGHAMDYLPHEPPGTVMEVKAPRHDQRESDKVAWVICDKVRRFTSAKPSGKKDCYSDVIK